MALSALLYTCSDENSAGSSEKPGGLEEIIVREIHLHPKAQVVDIYKLMYQGAFGIGHLIAGRADALDYLKEEVSSMGTGKKEPMLQPCNTQGTQFRVNLRPFMEAGYDIHALADAMLESVRLTTPDTTGFARLWAEAGEILVRLDSVRFSSQYNEMTKEIAALGYRAAHHSDVYRGAYKPAYRVVHADALRKYFPDILIRNGK